MIFRDRKSVDWKYAYASAIGTSHLKTGIECQDRCICTVHKLSRHRDVLIAAVADGAGSAQMAATASALTSQSFVKMIEICLSTGNGVEAVTRDVVLQWLKALQVKILQLAEENKIDIREFASTILGAVVGREGALFVQIGDGAIVVSRRDRVDDYEWVFWPQQGQYANQTYFITDEIAGEVLKHQYVNETIDDVALFSDGLQSLALHFQTQTAHAPFFRAMFKPLLVKQSGHLESLSSTLASYLNSDVVNQRTDDDKSLILATRRSPR